MAYGILLEGKVMSKKNTENKFKELAKGISKKAEPYIDDLKNKTDPVVKELKAKAEPVMEDAKTKAEPYIDDIKTKAEPYIDDLKNKADPVIKKVKNQASKLVCKEEVFIQYSDHELRAKDIMDRAKEDYIKKGHEENDIKEIELYIKPADNAAYYVVNHEDTGKLTF